MTTLDQSKPADEARDSVLRSGAVSSCNDLLSVRLTHLDLFSGIGGFALAAQAAGFTTIGFSEIEPYACKILKRHWPDVPNYGDIRHVTAKALADSASIRSGSRLCETITEQNRHQPSDGGESVGRTGSLCDLLTGGFPCQPYSTAGKRGGASDDRALWPEMFRVIGETRPAWVLGENVPGIISMELDRVLDDLESIGYSAWPLGIPACAVDARHRRERVWIVAYSDGGQHKSGGTQPSVRNVARCDGAQDGAVANSERIAAGARRSFRPEARKETATHGQAATDANLVNGHGSGHGASAISQQQATNVSGCKTISDDGSRSGERPGREISGESQPARWQPEPGMGRVADGIPNRSHRLRGLGNAIVPQVAETLIREMARTLNASHKPSGESPR